MKDLTSEENHRASPTLARRTYRFDVTLTLVVEADDGRELGADDELDLEEVVSELVDEAVVADIERDAVPNGIRLLDLETADARFVPDDPVEKRTILGR